MSFLLYLLLLFQPLEGPQVVPISKLTVLKAPDTSDPLNSVIIWQSSIKLDNIKRNNEYIFVSPNQPQAIIINAIAISIVDGKLDVKEFEHNLLVVSDEPTPPDDPPIDPPVDPTLSEFQKVVKSLTKSFPLEEQQKVANCYSRIAKAIENGKIAVLPPGTEVITNPALAFSTFTSCTKASLGVRWEQWRPAFEKINESANKQGMKTIYDVAVLMRSAQEVLGN